MSCAAMRRISVIFCRVNLVTAVFFALAAMSQNSSMAQGDMGPIGAVVLEDMIREQNQPSYGYQKVSSRCYRGKRHCKTAKASGRER